MAHHRILVSGAGGFVGSVLADLVASHPAKEGIEFLPLTDAEGREIDIRNAKLLADRITQAQPTAVIHLAAVASPSLADRRPEEAWAVNVMGTFNLAHSVLKYARQARFVFAGSSEAYGESFAMSEAPIDEDCPFRPLSTYGATKAAADLMLGQMAKKGLRATRFRPFNHIGPGQPARYAISSFARQIVRIEHGWQEPVIRVGNLKIRRDFLDVRDVARIYLQAAIGEEERVSAFNLATGNPTPIEDMLHALVALSNASMRIEIDPTLLRPDEIRNVSGSFRRAREAFDWIPSRNMEDTLGEILTYWRHEAATNPDAFHERA